jgi:hypothetical protein
MEALCTQQQLKDLEVKIIHICQYVQSTNNWTIKNDNSDHKFQNESTITIFSYITPHCDEDTQGE